MSSTATVIVKITTTTMTTVHQRPLPYRHHCFRYSDQTTSHTTRKDSLRSARLWKLISIGPLIRPHASRQYHHMPPRATNLLHVPSRSRSASVNVIHYVIYATLALGDVITATSWSWRHHCHDIAYVICRSAAYVILWFPSLTFCNPGVP